MTSGSVSSPTAIKKVPASHYRRRHCLRGSRDTTSANDIRDTVGRRQRTRKACERCRMKKTKCNEEFPCSRCADGNYICTAGLRKIPQYRELPPGYIEALEQSQLTPVRTIHKLYFMVRHSQPWNHNEPGININGYPVVHDISNSLGCIKVGRHSYLPIEFSPPED